MRKKVHMITRIVVFTLFTAEHFCMPYTYSSAHSLRPPATSGSIELHILEKDRPFYNEPLFHFPKWLRANIYNDLKKDLGQEAAQFILKGRGSAYLGDIPVLPANLKKKLKPKLYLDRIVVCEGALSSMARSIKDIIPRYRTLSIKAVETELLQVTLQYGELEMAIERRNINFNKLKEEILKIYGEASSRCPEFQKLLSGFKRQYGYNLRKDTKLLRKLVVHLITETVLFGNLPKVMPDKSWAEEDIALDVIEACISFIEDAGLIPAGEIERLKMFAKKGGATKSEKKKMRLSAFDFMSRHYIEKNIKIALEEDKHKEDKTALYTIREGQKGVRVIEAQEEGILAGIEIATLVFKIVDPDLDVLPLLLDGDELHDGDAIMAISGNARSIASAERVALNYLQQLSGPATTTSKFVKPTVGTNAKILDTRKTIPGMRPFQKYAVRVGGGKNHRMDLAEMVMIKDTHLSFIREELGIDEGAIKEAVRRVRAVDKDIFIEVEVRNIKEAKEALECGVDRIMFDKMSCDDMKEAVDFIHNSKYYRENGKPSTEASGNVIPRRVRGIAEAGVDYISAGAITRSAPSLDIHLKPEPLSTAPILGTNIEAYDIFRAQETENLINAAA